MQKLEIDKTANQSIRYQGDQEVYEIIIRTTANATFFSLKRDNIEIISNQILISNKLLINSIYQVTKGNFIFYCLNDELANYENFGVTQFLYYATNEELLDNG